MYSGFYLLFKVSLIVGKAEYVTLETSLLESNLLQMSGPFMTVPLSKAGGKLDLSK